jgi:hypothetical protein
VKRKPFARSRLLAATVLALRLSLAAAISTSLVGCVVIDFTKLIKSKKKQKKSRSSSDEEENADSVDLGKARFPDDAKTPNARHSWETSRLEPDTYELSYVLAEEQQQKLLEAHRSFARSVNFKDVGNKFSWRVPSGCNSDLGCVYGMLRESNREALEPLTALFRDYAKEHKLKSDKLARLIVSFVQQIRYDIPAEFPFGVLGPANVVAQKRGDCDSKALLAYLLLREFGIDVVIVSSSAHKHAMIGVGMPATGKNKFSYGGHDYAYVELTAMDSPIGFISPTMLQPNDWTVVNVRGPATRTW